MKILNPKAEEYLREQFRRLAVRLQDYRLFRLIVVYGIGALGILLVGIPLNMKITEASEMVMTEKGRSGLINQINEMRTMKRLYLKRVNQNADMDSWVTYILQATRDCNLEIGSYTPAPGGYSVGPLSGMVMRCDLSGDYLDFYKFMVWIENNPWGSRLLSANFFQKRPGKPDLSGMFSIAVLVNPSKKSGEGTGPGVKKKTAPGEESAAAETAVTTPSPQSKTPVGMPPSSGLSKKDSGEGEEAAGEEAATVSTPSKLETPAGMKIHSQPVKATGGETP
jgi:hypothetical protein